MYFPVRCTWPCLSVLLSKTKKALQSHFHCQANVKIRGEKKHHVSGSFLLVPAFLNQKSVTLTKTRLTYQLQIGRTKNRQMKLDSWGLLQWWNPFHLCAVGLNVARLILTWLLSRRSLFVLPTVICGPLGLPESCLVLWPWYWFRTHPMLSSCFRHISLSLASQEIIFFL